MNSVLMDYLLICMVITAIWAAGARKLSHLITIFAFQSWLLAAVGFFLSRHGEEELLIAAGITVVIKGMLIPGVLFFVLMKLGIDKEMEMFVGGAGSVIISIGLVILSYSVITPDLAPTAVSLRVLKVAVSLLLNGLFLMIARKKAITQVLGILFMENGMYLAAMALTNGMPLVVELGVFFDALVGVIIMGILTYKIKQTFNSIDTDHLRSLRG